MFRGLAGEFGIERVALKLSTADGRQLKTIRLTLAHDFDEDLAAVLGKAGGQCRKALESGDLESATMPIDAIRAVAKLKSGPHGDAVQFRALFGLKAVGKPGSGEADPPVLLLSFECEFDPEAWSFLGAYAGTPVWADLIPMQTTLELEEPARVRRVQIPARATATTIDPGELPDVAP